VRSRSGIVGGSFVSGTIMALLPGSSTICRATASATPWSVMRGGVMPRANPVSSSATTCRTSRGNDSSRAKSAAASSARVILMSDTASGISRWIPLSAVT
jgi:hypothetical protein